MKKYSQAGMSLVGAIMAVGVTAVAALGTMQVFKNLAVSNQYSQEGQDKKDIHSLIEMIIEDDGTCRLSLAGNDPISSPVTFKKIDIDQPTEGLPIELWLGNQNSTHGKKVKQYRYRCE